MATHNFMCPKCANNFELDDEQLAANGGRTTCPNCNSALHIVGDFAYVPVDDDTNPLGQDAQEETPPPFEPEQIAGTATDPLLPQARKFLTTCNAITVPMLMMYFSIPQERAQQLMDALEQTGAVGPSQGGAPRNILIDHNPGLTMTHGRTLEQDQQLERMMEQMKNNPRVRTFGCNCGPIVIGLLIAWIIFSLLK